MPALPVTAPGLAPPGPSLVRQGLALGDPPPAEPGPRRGKPKAPESPRPPKYLQGLVRSCLYTRGTVIPCTAEAASIGFSFMPGRLEGPEGVLDGPGRCRLMVVGKCLGPSEVAAGRPFHGPGSRPLWTAWTACGMPKPGPELPTYLTNLLRFCPPAQYLSRLPRAWVLDGLHLLHQEFAVCRPELVLVLGADALKALLGNKAKIDDYRGRTASLSLDCRATPDDPPDVHTAMLVVADHPAAVARDPDKESAFRSAVAYAARRLGYGEAPEAVPLDHRAVYTLVELKSAVAQSVRASAGGGYVAFDCEWEGRHPSDPGSYVYTVQWSHAPGHARVAFLRRRGGAANPAMPEGEAAAELRKLLADAPQRGARLVGHFAKADLPWLLAAGVDCYEAFVGPDDDPQPDGRTRLFGWQKAYAEGGFDTFLGAHSVDECFPSSTYVATDRGPLTIGEIVNQKLPVKVLSCDLLSGRLVYRRVTGFLKKEPFHPVVTVKHQLGAFHCTSNHKIWTSNRGYVEAGALTGDDSLCVVRRPVPEAEVAEQQGAFLREVLFGEVAAVAVGHPGQVVLARGAREVGRPDARPPESVTGKARPAYVTRDHRKDNRDQDAERYAPPPTRGIRGERSFLPPGGKAPLAAGDGVVAGDRREDRPRRPGAPDLLQNRRRTRSADDRYRAGRRQSQQPQGAGQGSPPEHVSESSRVVGVSLQEFGVRSLPGGGRGDDPFVYCLEVEQTHNFFAEGVLVSNCQRLKLEILAANLLGLERYDTPMLEWVQDYLKANKLKKSDLKGYGNAPEEIIAPYAAYDCDVAGRLYLYLNGDPVKGTGGALDRDAYGNSCRQIFGLRMRAWGAWAEMERYGLLVDRHRHRELRDVLLARREELLAEIRAKTDWPDFDPAKRLHRVELLFGEEYLDGKPAARPEGALSLYLEPYKATDTRGGGRLWADAVARAQANDEPPPLPGADKEVLVHLSRVHPLARLLKDIDTLATAAKIMFRAADEADPDNPHTEEVHEKGLLACLCGDGRVRSRFGLTETGRGTSSSPNLQNVSASVDEQYDRILQWGKEAPEGSAERLKSFVSRSVFRAQPGWYLVSADLKGAEIAAAAWGSGDPVLIEHARRATLDESDPDWLDLHSDLANRAFKLGLSLKEVKSRHKPLRTAAKRARFGHYYGASPETILRKAQEDDPNVTLENVRAIVKGHDETYPVLAGFFARCRERVSSKGYLVNGYGAVRRFRPASDRDLVAAQEREAQNWSCQGLVADNITAALGLCWYYIRRRRLRSRVVLSVHDSIVLECPADEVGLVVDGLLPACMAEGNPVVVSDLDGTPLPRGPYHFGIDVGVYRNWGVEVPEAEWRADCERARAELQKGVAA